MSHANRPDNGQRQPADERDLAFDLTRGIAAYTGSRLVAGLAKVISRHPDAVIGNAFNRKQIACKLWARERLLECKLLVVYATICTNEMESNTL